MVLTRFKSQHNNSHVILLLKGNTMVQILFPSSLINERKVDEFFEDQRDIANSLGFDTAIFDGTIARGLQTGEAVLYRGWIMNPKDYSKMESAVNVFNSKMVTPADCYVKGQYLDNWYEQFSHLTPKSYFFYPDVSDEELLGIDHDGAFVVKDSSKSFKHYWDTACYAGDKGRLPKVVSGFRELSDHQISGSLIVREFEQWLPVETRLWWVHGELVASSPHPDTPDEFREFNELELYALQEAVQSLNCPFVTTDVVRNIYGEMRVVEVGDGQVSDVPSLETWEQVLSAF